MNKNDFVAQVAEKAQVSKKDAAAVVDATFNVMANALANGEKVQFVGFGTFEVRERAARTVRNPRTGETLEVPASRIPAFKPGLALKKSVNN